MNTTRLQTLLLSIAENNYYKNVISEWQMNVGLPTWYVWHTLWVRPCMPVPFKKEKKLRL
jgi:hypothetical protein